jgi:hypothetical protein
VGAVAGNIRVSMTRNEIDGVEELLERLAQAVTGSAEMLFIDDATAYRVRRPWRAGLSAAIGVARQCAG